MAVLTNTVVACQIVEQGANHRVWQKIVRTTDAQGHSFLTTNRAVVELATGLNYRDPATGQWLPAKEEIDPAPGGAIAPFGQHQVSWANNLNAANAVVVQMSNGQTLQSGILGLSYYDTASGQSVMIGQIQDCQGQIVGSNQVIYADAFKGVSANVRYTYTKAGLEQDVVLLKQPPAPEAFGLSSATTVLQVLTEFSAAPAPQIQTNLVAARAGGLPDETMDFGPMKMIRGKAFLVGSNSTPAAVSKQWVNVNGRAILVESVRLGAVAKQLARLPLMSRTDLKSTNGSPLYAVSAKRLLPARRAVVASKGEMAMGKTPSLDQGFVLDYVVVNGGLSDYTFQAGTTYFVSGPVYCSGTTTIAGGAIIKYPDDTTAFIEIDGSLTCQTDPYHPAIFTAADDNSVGESVNDCSPWCGHGSIQPGGYANPALELDGRTFSLHDVHILYAQEALQVTSGGNANFANVQIVNCQTGIDDLWDEGVNSQVTLNNCLLASPDPNHAGNLAFAGGTSGTQFQLQNCTVDHFAALTGTGGDGSGPGSLDAEGSIFSTIGDFGSGGLSGGMNGFYNTPDGFGTVLMPDPAYVWDPTNGWVWEPQYPYLQVGGGSYYLNAQVSWSGGAFWPVNPPVDYTGQTITANTLGPQSQESNSLGYNYPHLDYVFSQSQVNGNLAIQPGVIVAWQGAGLSCAGPATITFDGTVANPCYFLPCELVQEQTGGGIGVTDTDGSDWPTVYATFTKFWALDNQASFFDVPNSTYANGFVYAYNCEFAYGTLGGGVAGGLNLDLENCLLENSWVNFWGLRSTPSCSLKMQNCTQRGGGDWLRNGNPYASWSVTVHDSAFDGTQIVTPYGNFSSEDCSYNAYLSGASRWPNDANDRTVSGGFNWQTGPLGGFYLLPSSPLINAGDRSANDAKLRHFTTQVDQMPEGDSTVDIGYHYVALGADGNPPVTGVPGIPDYVLDATLPVVAISAPADNSSFDTSRINVTGTFTEPYLKQITVNGVLAYISGNTFEAMNVPLGEGANTVTATAEDLVGNTGTATITVTGSATPVDPVQLQAMPIAGFVPLNVTLQVSANVPGAIQQVLYDFNGDGVSDQTATDLNPISHTFSSAGQYFPVVTIVTTAGRFSSSGGWNSTDPNRLRINVQMPPVQQRVIAITDPVDLKCDASGNLYVLSGTTATITEYDGNGTVVRSLSGIGASPSGLDVDSAGNVYVAMTGDNQVWKYIPTGASFEADASFGNGGRIGLGDGSAGANEGQFNAPFDVAVSPDGGTLSVSDSANNRIQQFNATDGTFIGAFGQQGSDIGQFNAPKGLTYDSTGYLYIVDSGNNRIALAESSVVIGTSGTSGTALGQFQGAINLGVGDRGIYVTDTGNNRVQSFDPILTGHGSSPTPFNSRGSISTELSLNQPDAVAPVADFLEEEVYIADTGNNRVILVKLPSDNPAAIWDSMKQSLLSGDINTATSDFSISSADEYRRAFLAIGTSDLETIMSLVPSLTPVAIDDSTAEYKFDKIVQGVTLTFRVEFVKENGVWKILSY